VERGEGKESRRWLRLSRMGCWLRFLRRRRSELWWSTEHQFQVRGEVNSNQHTELGAWLSGIVLNSVLRYGWRCGLVYMYDGRWMYIHGQKSSSMERRRFKMGLFYVQILHPPISEWYTHPMIHITRAFRS
jgi:hypothetical protein